MTDLEIQKALLEYYEKTLAEMPKGDLHEAIVFCFEKKIVNGLCYASRNVFGRSIDCSDWVNENITIRGAFWQEIPFRAEGIEELVYFIQYRIDKLKEIINNQ